MVVKWCVYVVLGGALVSVAVSGGGEGGGGGGGVDRAVCKLR